MSTLKELAAKVAQDLGESYAPSKHNPNLRALLAAIGAMPERDPSVEWVRVADAEREALALIAERDEALLNAKRIDEAEFLRRAEAGETSGEHLTPIGRMWKRANARADAAETAARELWAALRLAMDHVNHAYHCVNAGGAPRCDCGADDAMAVASPALARHAAYAERRP